MKLVGVEGRRLVFEVEAHDGVELIGKGLPRALSIINRARFDEKLDHKARRRLGTCRPGATPGR